MKRFVLVAMVVGVLALALSSTAWAQGPVQPGLANRPGGPGMRMAGSGLTQSGTGCGLGVGMRGGAPAWAGQPEEVATLLGLTQEQIHTERLTGRSLAQIAAGKGVSEAKLTSTILDAKKADLDQLVAGDKLTQAQADAMVARMQQQVPAMIQRTTTGPAMGQGGQANAGSRMGIGGRWNR